MSYTNVRNSFYSMLYMTKSKQYKFDNKRDTIVKDSTYFGGTTQRNEAKTKLESSNSG